MQDPTVEITGLTAKQKQLLETMWAIDSPEDFIAWSSSLDSETKHMVSVLAELLTMTLEDNVDDTSMAKIMLANIKVTPCK